MRKCEEKATRGMVLRPSTYNKLWDLKRPGDTFSDVIDKLLEAQGHE